MRTTCPRCDHKIDDHTPVMRCRVCGQECGISFEPTAGQAWREMLDADQRVFKANGLRDLVVAQTLAKTARRSFVDALFHASRAR